MPIDSQSRFISFPSSVGCKLASGYSSMVDSGGKGALVTY